MARSKEGKKDEFYLSQIRALKSENRNLKKRIKQLEKREHFYEDRDYDEDVELPVGEKNEDLSKFTLCPDCSKGQMEPIQIIDRIFEKCTVCDYRTKARKL